MKAISFKNAQDFLKTTHDFLVQNEAVNNVILGVCSGLESGKIKCSSPHLISVIDHKTNQVKAAAVQAPSMNNLVLSFGSENYVEAIAEKLREQKAALVGVVGPAKASEMFAKVWSHHIGSEYKLVADLRMYKLTSVNGEIKKQGSLRAATHKDLSLAKQWFVEFAAEALPFENREPERSEKMAVEKIENGELFFLDIQGQAVTMCGQAGATENGARVVIVYTPIRFRKLGYASSAVLQLSERLLAQGRKFCVLYADLANPTSNGIYQKIGYEPICDSRHYLF